MGIEYTVQDQVRLDAIQSFSDEYKDLYDTWKSLDGKAQASATIAGIFLAAAFAIAKDIPAAFLPFQRILLAISIGLLVVTVCFCLVGLLVRRIYAPPIGENTKGLVEDLLPSLSPSKKGARLSRFIKDRFDLWDVANSDLKQKCSRKAIWVSIAQGTLLAAIAAATAVTIIAVVN